MANTRWCDHGVYPAYNITPTWGVPQEGDGLAKALSTSSSIARIKFSAVPTTTGGASITIMGLSFTSLTNLTNATSASLAADALASLVNITTTGLAAFPGAPICRNFLYARGPANGAPAGTCEIMTRAGSALFNYSATATSNQITTTGVSNVSSTLADQQFSGGVSGCYGYLFTIAGIWPTNIPAYNYGLWTSNQPMGSTPQPGDTIWIRSKTIPTSSTPNANSSIPELGTPTQPVVFVYDDGTEWPADGPEPVLRIQASNGNSGAVWTIYMGGYTYHKGTRYASGQRNVVFELTTGVANSPVMNMSLGYGCRIDCFDLYGIDSAVPGLIMGQSTQYNVDLFDCRISWPKQRTGSRYFTFGSNATNRVNFHGGVIEQQAPTDLQDMIIGATTNQTAKLVFTGTSFKGFVNSRLIQLGAVWAIGTTVFLNCSFEGITDIGPSFKSLTNGLLSTQIPLGQNCVIISSTSGKQENVIDSPQGLVSWWPSGGYPTLNARLRDNTPYSYRVAPASIATTISPFNPLETPRFAVRTSLATNTIRVNLLVEKTLSWTTANISALVSYTGTDDASHEESNWAIPGQALTPNTATWTSIATDPSDTVDRVLYAGSYFNRFEMTIKTKVPVKIGSDIVVQIRISSLVGNSSQQVFVCPLPILSQE